MVGLRKGRGLIDGRLDLNVGRDSNGLSVAASGCVMLGLFLRGTVHRL